MDALRKFLEANSQQLLADALGCSQSLVSHWVNGRKTITAERAKQIEEATLGTILRHELRPDLFDAPAANSDQSEAA